MNYVLTLAIGPVQGFIVSARRSRDLWAGSWLLSEIAKSAAQKLQENGAKMIFPYAKNGMPENVGNKIQVVLENCSVDELSSVVQQAKEAANKRFLDEANGVLKKLGSQKNSLRLDIWNLQKTDYVEVQVAWTGFEASEENTYLIASQTAAELLAARKATRDFAALQSNDNIQNGLPKSSLDGARETVLLENSSEALRKKLGLNQSEQLDCAGVVKRLCGKPEQFTPITRVAMDSWLEKNWKKKGFQTALKHVDNIYQKLVLLGFASEAHGNENIPTEPKI